jgi:pentatricopeptide repeat protein
VVSYNIVINGFFSEGQVDKAYSLLFEMQVFHRML